MIHQRELKINNIANLLVIILKGRLVYGNEEYELSKFIYDQNPTRVTYGDSCPFHIYSNYRGDEFYSCPRDEAYYKNLANAFADQFNMHLVVRRLPYKTELLIEPLEEIINHDI